MREREDSSVRSDARVRSNVAGSHCGKHAQSDGDGCYSVIEREMLREEEGKS